MAFDPDIPADAPDELQAFEELAEGENYAEELSDLLELLGQQHQVPNLVEAGGGFAATIPSYNSKSEVPDAELAQATDNDHDAVVIVNGELMRCTR